MPDTGSQDDRLAELKERWLYDTSPRVFLPLAEEYRRLGQTDEALKVLELGLESHPGHLSAEVARGRCLLELGRYSDALTVLEGVMARDATHLLAAKLLVETHLKRGDAIQARRHLDLYRTLGSADPEVEALEERIRDLQLADPAPLPDAGPAVRDPAAGVEAAPTPPATSASPAPSTSPAPAPAAAFFAGPSAASEPFAGLLQPTDQERYLESLGREGLFSVPATAPAPPSPTTSPATSAPGQQAPPVPDAPGPSATVPEPSAQPEPPPEPVSEPVSESASEPSPPAAGQVTAEPEPTEAPATATIGQLYLRQGHYEEAERIFREVLAENPENSVAVEGLRTLEALRRGDAQGEQPEPEVAPAEPSPPPPAVSDSPVAASGDQDARSEAAASAVRSVVAELSPGEAGPEGKIKLLERYLSLVRGGAEQHVS